MSLIGLCAVALGMALHHAGMFDSASGLLLILLVAVLGVNLYNVLARHPFRVPRRPAHHRSSDLHGGRPAAH